MNNFLMSISLTTRIIVTFSVIAFFFLLNIFMGYSNSQRVSEGLEVINGQSAPIVATVSKLNSLVLGAEPLVLKLTESRLNQVFLGSSNELKSNIDSTSSKLRELENLTALLQESANFSLDTQSVKNQTQSLSQIVAEIESETVGLIQRQQDIVKFTEFSESEIGKLNQLQSTITPLLQQTLLDLEDESVISIVNEINASITYGLLVIERIGSASTPNEISSLKNEFVGWQNIHSNLLPSLIFASQEKTFQQFVKKLSQLTLSLLDSIEGKQGLLNIQSEKLSLIQQQSESLSRIQADIRQANLSTQRLLDDSFTQNQALSEQINNGNSTQSKVNLTMGIAMMIGIAVVAFGITISIRRSMNTLMTEMSYLSKGTLRTISPSKSNDEFGKLNNYLLNVVDGLKNVVTGIERSAREVENSVEHVSNSSTDTRQIVEQQKEDLDTIAAALVEMKMVSEDVAKHTENTHEKIVEAGHFAVEGRTQMQNSRENVDQIMNQTTETVAAINKVDQGVKSIEGIIETIENIAEQTNLLALNAAIEAARAGEQGRGFAVVSDEVRSLANRTQESTLEIQRKINSMIADSKSAVKVIKNGESIVSSSIEQAKRADETIAQFEQKMTEIQDLSYLISTATEEQVRTVEALEKNLIDVTMLADKTNVQAEKAEQEAKSQVRIVNELEEKLSQFDIEN